MVVSAAVAHAGFEEGRGRRRGARTVDLRGRPRMPGGCETSRGQLRGPRRSCRRSPGRVLSWRGGGCGSDALSWLRFVMVPETPRPPQLTLRDYHMTEAEGLRAAAASLAEEGARRRGASPLPPAPPLGFRRPHPQYLPSTRSTQPSIAVPAAAPHPGRDTRHQGTGPYFFLFPFASPASLRPFTLSTYQF